MCLQEFHAILPVRHHCIAKIRSVNFIDNSSIIDMSAQVFLRRIFEVFVHIYINRGM